MAKAVPKKGYTIKTNLYGINPVLKEILLYLKNAQVKDDDLHDIKLAVQEAMVNAMKHGNKCNEEQYVIVNFELSQNKVRVSVQDEGKGYDYKKIPDPTLDENIAKGHGRGVFLIRRLMDEVHFNDSGNRIEMVKYVNK